MNLADLSIKRPIFITCLVILMLAVGFVSLKTRPVDLFPDVNFPIVTVTTTYPGAGPAEIETLVTKPLEDEITTIAGLKRLTSNNFEGISQVVAEFHLETDIKYAEQQVRDRVSVAKAKLPREIKEPIIRRIDPSDQPIFTIALQADLPDAQLYDIADNFIKPRLVQVQDVGLVDIVGGRKREIHITLDRKKLEARELSVGSVAAQIGASGENIPSGKVNEGDKETIFRAIGEFHSMKDIENTLVNLYGNEVPTKVSDVGEVHDTLEDEQSRVFVNGTKSLFIDIYRQSGSNTLAVVEAVKKKTEQLATELKRRKEKINLAVIRDGSNQIRVNVDDVQQSILLGILLTVLVVYFFLANGRSTIITGLALPNSLLGAFILMALAGFTVNLVTLLALSLAIGLLIDDAIVVRENIFRHIEEGADPVTAAREGTREVTLAVVATTLVIIAVFGPVAFMKGIIGQFLKQFGLTVCFAMAISLFDALTIAPMLSAYFAGNLHPNTSKGLWNNTVGRVLRLFDKFQSWLEVVYERVLKATLRHPILTLVTSFAVFLVSMATVTKIPKTFIPPQDNGEFAIEMDLPPGTNLDAMNRLGNKADQILRSNKEVELTALTVGDKNGEANHLSFYIKLVPTEKRSVNTSGMKDRVRDQFKEFAAANPKIEDYDPSGAGQSRQFMLNLIGTDQEELEKYSTQVMDKLRTDKRLKDLDTSYRPGKPEFQVILKPGKPEIYGVNTGTVGDELRAQVEGVTPAKFRENGNEYDVRVRLKEDQRNLRDEFAGIFVPNVNRKLIRLPDIADPKISQGPATINRQDRGRFIQISADIASGAGLGDVMDDVDKMFANEIKLPPSLRYSYVGNSENFSEFAGSVVVAFAFAFLFVYLVLSSLYESFITPFAIMLALPLALCGAFVALFVTQQSLNLFCMLGITMLLGVACKNSILLVDYANQLIASGMSRADALIKAGKTRLRPILMTSMALIAGTLPVALGLNEASRQRTSMGIAIIGGVISSTILTLVVVPAAFTYIDRVGKWITGLFKSLSEQKPRRKSKISHDEDVSIPKPPSHSDKETPVARLS
jgi:hydrophobic/amphiphilic exporter-1 (mainly G- bacteria), HAE1 family